MIPAEVLAYFDTTYPFSYYMVPAIYTILFLVIIGIVFKYCFSKASFAGIGAGVVAMIAVFGLFGVSLTGAMEAQASPEHRMSGTILDIADSGNVGIVENNIVDTQVVLFKTLDGGLIGPVEITTGNTEKAIGEVVTLSCDIPTGGYATQIITCDVVAIV